MVGLLKAAFRVAKILTPIILGLIGFAGIPGDIDTWSKWINKAMYDPRVTELAEKAVAVAEFVNQPWFRILLVIVATALLFWGWRPFWRLRHRLWFWGRQIVSEVVWISEEQAMRLVERSEWAVSRKRKSQKARSILEELTKTLATLDPAAREKEIRYSNWCRLVLRSFEEDFESSVKAVEAGKEYEEIQLKEWLEDRYTDDLVEEFGVP